MLFKLGALPSIHPKMDELMDGWIKLIPLTMWMKTYVQSCVGKLDGPTLPYSHSTLFGMCGTMVRKYITQLVSLEVLCG